MASLLEILLMAQLQEPPWAAMTLQNSWGNYGSGLVEAQYREWNLFNEVEIIGAISGGTITNGTVVATLTPAPVSQQNFSLVIIAGASAAGINTYMAVETSGDLVLEGIPSDTTALSFHGWYSLDA